ncbi:helix-turn-helix domain-containing protein [Mycobacteroides abscessus]|uniref:hypothetical protein n=2 Tax=Mycobacteroides abscessus TaxID=36809 RepID=UPI0009261B3B|nr:hypothetical protein [Mycobacteroides abscessus]SKU68363.1 Uncharacterised protein [Mycobacteroides abscessus subsp. massiliense]MDO3042077.1 hypothetical protein [Mycobacteroides abscessus subsp. abscessus]SIK15641.1 Uncharacterised protein [Mycobacteroides abscessus subsp. abscessus]SIL53557.1 Uncharacterised protein [Mycobacteroides abscessus subsp. abscessus]SIM45519.1 Uncharacterised protein [Mycobacteroides abscessus subsp. abscessus]
MPTTTQARPYDAHMATTDTPPPGTVSLATLAEEMGWKPATASTMLWRAERRRKEGTPKPGDLPEPAGRIGKSPYFWETDIARWKQERPGPGAGGGRPWHK